MCVRVCVCECLEKRSDQFRHFTPCHFFPFHFSSKPKHIVSIEIRLSIIFSFLISESRHLSFFTPQSVESWPVEMIDTITATSTLLINTATQCMNSN